MFTVVAKTPKRKAVKEKRSYYRRPARIDIRFFSDSIFFSGAILDLSENGMFINTKKSLSWNEILVVLFPSENEDVQVVARVRHIKRSNDGPYGIGVEILTPPAPYVNYIKNNIGVLYG